MDGVPESEPYDFTVICPLCGTRQDTFSGTIGGKLQCPDCHLEFIVQEPARAARRRRGTLSAAGDELTLRETPTREPYRKLADDLLKSAAREVARAPAPLAGEPPRRRAIPRDEPSESAAPGERELPPADDRPFPGTGFRFLRHPATAGRWLLLSVIVYVEWGAIQMAARAADGGGLEQILGVFFRVFACVFGGLGACYLTACLLHLTQESALGRDTIDGWPGLHVTEWIFDGWPVGASLFLALGPGFVLGQGVAVVLQDNAWFWWLGFSCGAVAMVFAFPVLVLSFLESGVPYSRSIWLSLRDAPQTWKSCWLRWGGMVAGWGLCGGLRMGSTSSARNLALAAAGVLLAMLYFRLLGRLAWACGPTVPVVRSADAVDERVGGGAGNGVGCRGRSSPE